MTDSVHLFVHRATAEQIARGEAAILAHFEKAGCTPAEAAKAGFRQQVGERLISDQHHSSADAWVTAEGVGVEAACPDHAEEPIYSNVVVDMDSGKPETLTNDECTAEIDRLLALSADELEAECSRAGFGECVKTSLPGAVRSWRLDR